MNKNRQKKKVIKKPIKTTIMFLLAWLIALGIRSAIDNPEMFIKGLLHQ